MVDLSGYHLPEHIKKMELYAIRISNRPLWHNSVPVWRSRAFENAIVLLKHINILSESQLTLIVELIGEFLISFNDSTSGYYDRWVGMRADLVERQEYLQEEDNVASNEDNKKFWLISIAGNDWCFDISNETVSITIELLNGETPVDWFMNKPEVHNRFGFVPHTLLGFWKITKKQFKEFNE